MCVSERVSEWVYVWVCVSSLQERREMLLQFSHCIIYLRWLSLCNSECIFVHLIWIYIYIWLYTVCMRPEGGMGLLFRQQLLLLKWNEFVLWGLPDSAMHYVCEGGGLLQTFFFPLFWHFCCFLLFLFLFFCGRNPAACMQTLTQSVSSSNGGKKKSNRSQLHPSTTWWGVLPSSPGLHHPSNLHMCVINSAETSLSLQLGAHTPSLYSYSISSLTYF